MRLQKPSFEYAQLQIEYRRRNELYDEAFTGRKAALFRGRLLEKQPKPEEKKCSKQDSEELPPRVFVVGRGDSNEYSARNAAAAALCSLAAACTAVLLFTAGPGIGFCLSLGGTLTSLLFTRGEAQGSH